MPPWLMKKCRLAATTVRIAISVRITSVYSLAHSGALAAAASASAATALSSVPAGWYGGCGVGRLCALTSARPSRPNGRTISTSAMATKASTSADFGSHSTPKACSRPISSEARKAPAIEPRPPTTTTTKASTITARSICSVIDSRGICSAPASPARKAPRANTPVNSTRRFTPSASAITPSLVAARTSMPQRVRWNSHHNTPNTSGPAASSSSVYCGTKAPAISTAPASPGARGANRSSGPQTQSARSCTISTTPKVASSWKISGAA